MLTVNVHEVKTPLSRWLQAVEAGEEVVIARAGQPMASLVSLVPAVPRRRFGMIAAPYTVPADFDAPLPEDTLASFEGH